MRESFFAARQFDDVADLNRKAELWCEGLAADRPWPEDRSKSVREVFEEERVSLLDLPQNPFPTEERVEVRVGKTPYVRFDKNDYSVPHTLSGKPLVVVASLEQVRIVRGSEVVATHPRSFHKGEVIEDPAHVEALWRQKAAASKSRGLDRLTRAAPMTEVRHIRQCERLLKAISIATKTIDA